MQMRSLGQIGGNVRGILITGGTNAAPIVATIGAGHGLKNGDRIVITGVTGLTAMNGEWEVAAVAATTVALVGSVGNGAFGGTAVVAVVCDRTPFQPRYSVIGRVNAHGTGVTVAPILTVTINGSDDNVTFASAVQGLAIPAITAAGYGVCVEVTLKKYMEAIGSGFTSGLATVQLMS